MPGLVDFFRAAIGSNKNGTIDALRSAAAIADTFDAFSGEAAQAMLLEVLLPWAGVVARNAVHKWGTSRRLCRFEHAGVGCRTKPIGVCHACHRPICLAHAFVGADATLVCWPCMKIGAANAKPWTAGADVSDDDGWAPASRQQQDGTDRIEWACAVLGVSQDASEDDLRAAYKAASKKYHPDRAKNTSDAKSRTEKLKMINVAKEIIWRHRGL